MSEHTILPSGPAQTYGKYNRGMKMSADMYQEHGFDNIRTTQNALSNMQGLKASLPSSTMNFGTNPTTQNDSFMLMPSGQAVPLSAFYGASGLPYMSSGVMPGLVGGNGYNAGSMGSYNYPYLGQIPTQNSNIGPINSPAWIGNDENTPLTSDMGGVIQGDYHGIPQFTHPATTNAHNYVAGPIQAIKTHDNKGYEMMNLEELLSRDPPIPRAVPALWTNQEDMTLAKCLQNPEGITNVYIRGFMPETTDEDLHRWASRFGDIESCKAIIDQDTGKCKGFGFVMYYSPASAENCIRGFFHLGFQASYAQKSRNSRLKDLEDRSSTNIYCTGVPIDWNESDLAKHFLPYNAVSTKICRDSPSGVSKEVGFARFESRETAEHVIREYHSALVEHDQIKLYLRFADTKAQKQLKQQSQERRQWRSREYSYSVEHTPSPITGRLQSMHISPDGSYHSASGAGNNFTPATSVSPAEALNTNKIVNNRISGSWPTSGGLQSITNKQINGTPISTVPQAGSNLNKSSTTVTFKPTSDSAVVKTPSPKQLTVKIEPASGNENAAVAA